MANYTKKEPANVPADELVEIIMELQYDKENFRIEAEMSRSEQKDAEERADEAAAELDQFTAVDLGLDVLRYKFDKCNLQLVQKFEHSLQHELNTVTHAELF